MCLLAAGVSAQSAGVAQQGADVAAHYAAAQAHERAGDWAAAEREWILAISGDPQNARAWVNLGVALNRQNKVKEAINAWTRAIRLDSKLTGAHFNIGLVHVRSGEYVAALAPLKQSLLLEPENEVARRALVLALIALERFQEASREIARLLTRFPRDASLLELAAQSFMRQRRYAEAVVVLRRKLDLENATARDWAMYGDALDGARRTTEAVEAYERAVALAPDSNSTQYGLGYLYWKLYRYDEAERILAEVLRRDSQMARAAFTLGDLYLTKGQPARALPLLEQAARAYTEEFDTRFALGRALILLGQLKRGIEELRAAIRLDDRIADGHFQLGRALVLDGQAVEGKRELERARELNNARRAAEGERILKQP
jgi:superkiller protein 3